MPERCHASSDEWKCPQSRKLGRTLRVRPTMSRPAPAMRSPGHPPQLAKDGTLKFGKLETGWGGIGETAQGNCPDYPWRKGSRSLGSRTDWALQQVGSRMCYTGHDAEVLKKQPMTS